MEKVADSVDWRKKLVERNNPVFYFNGDEKPLSVGNGRFCFTVDESGLQTFPKKYFPLCTMAEWFWHSYPDAPADDSKLRLVSFDTYGRGVCYAVDETGQDELFYGLRRNAHKGNLAKIGFDFAAGAFNPISQTLDLWQGVIRTKFELGGAKVSAETLAHPDEDVIAFRVKAENAQPLKINISFPYPSHRKEAGDFSLPARHKTRVSKQTPHSLFIEREIDGTRLFAQIALGAGITAGYGNCHNITLNSDLGSIEASIRFTEKPNGKPPQLFDDCYKACIQFWENFWKSGLFLDFSEANDERARELERRIVLSRFLLAIQGRGFYPNAETGLTCNSWYGKFHLEMHYWHSAHFVYWGNPEFAEKSLSYYLEVLPVAREIARKQGYKGARWPKMCDPTGYNSPSSIGVLLLWQQPAPIAFCELFLASKKTAAEKLGFLQKFRTVVEESAEFICSFLHQNEDGSFSLGPPAIPAQERFDARTVLDPSFELLYFRYGLIAANEWRKALGENPNPEWERLAAAVPKPAVKDGVYLAHRNCPDTFTKEPFNTDHPSMLMLGGYLPDTAAAREALRGFVDANILNATLDRVLNEWNLDDLWGWDFPMMAMCAASLNRYDDAVKLLLLDKPKNVYLSNGHNRQGDKEDLPLYIPGNASLLLACAIMKEHFPPEWKIAALKPEV